MSEEIQIIGVRDRHQVIDLGLYPRHSKFEQPDTNTIYLGFNLLHNASTSATDWAIVKITFSAGFPTDKEILIGSWDNRASLGWA
jgi:hypothetical protein